MDDARGSDVRQGGQSLDPEALARREFLTKLTKVGATVPAVTLLLAANYKTASASAVNPYANGGSGSS